MNLKFAWISGAVVALGVAAYLSARWVSAAHERDRALSDQAEARAVEIVGPIRVKIDEQRASGEKPDIDKTFQVLHALDAASRNSASISEYVEELIRQDYRGVDPDACQLRKEMLEALIPVAIRVRGLSERDAMWESYRALLQASAVANSTSFSAELSLPMGGGKLGTTANAQVHAQALESLRASLAHREDLLAQIETLQTELYRIIDRSGPIYRRLLDEWQKLCLVRDSAYLAASRRDWNACEQFAREAIELSPSEREAHLLSFLAQVSQSETSPESEDRLVKALSEFIEQHPDCAAPALLLRGMARAKSGRLDESRADLQLASTRYPLQAEQLEDQFDPYRIRGYLRYTTSGRSITGLYEQMMLGAGEFSPELELATLETDRRRKQALVRDHFLRRRQARSWSHVLYDVAYCEELLRDDFQANFPEAPFLDVSIEKPLVGHDFAVLENRSDIRLHNVLVVLCLRFTNMQPDDYVAIPVEPAMPSVAPLAKTNVGNLKFEVTAAGVSKTLDDIVEPIRAIVFADEATFRVDSMRYKSEQLQRLETLRAVHDADSAGAMPDKVATVLHTMRDAHTGARVHSGGFLNQSVIVELPRELVLLYPLFSLKLSDREYAEGRDTVESKLDGERVIVTFGDTAGFEFANSTHLVVTARSALRSVSFAFDKGPDDEWKLAAVE